MPASPLIPAQNLAPGTETPITDLSESKVLTTAINTNQQWLIPHSARTRRATTNIAGFLLILLFIYTAVSKLSDLASFYTTLRQSPGSRPFAHILQYALPITELLIAALLAVGRQTKRNTGPERTPNPKPKNLTLLYSLIVMAGRVFTRRLGFIAAATLMLLFTFYIGYYLTFDKEQLPCSCGGVISGMTWTQHFFFNLFFTGLGIAGAVLEPSGGPGSKSRRRGT